VQGLRAGGGERREPSAVRAPPAQLVDDGRDLMGTGHEAAVPPRLQGPPVPVEGLRESLETGGDGAPVLLRVSRHERERLPHRLRGAGHRVELAQRLPGVRHGQLGLEPLAEQPSAAALEVVERVPPAGGGLGLVEPAQHLPLQVGAFVDTRRGVVGPAVLAGPDAEGGRDDRVEHDELVDVPVGDLAGSGRVGGHRDILPEPPGSARLGVPVEPTPRDHRLGERVIRGA
jgi:hypothetical protein